MDSLQAKNGRSTEILVVGMTDKKKDNSVTSGSDEMRSEEIRCISRSEKIFCKEIRRINNDKFNFQKKTIKILTVSFE
jgi:hypothetical protein